MQDELFDIVNGQDQVIGQETRSIVHRRGLWHRGVHVLLFTQDEKLLVQRRSKDRIHAPSALDCSVSEHVRSGEDYYTTATRGLQEEIGLVGIDIQPLVKFKMNYGPKDNEVSELYNGYVNPALVKFDPVEVESIEYYSLPDLQEHLTGRKTTFSYWFKQIIQWYLGYPSALVVLDKYVDLSSE